MGAGASEVTLPTGRVLPPFDGELLDGTWLSWSWEHRPEGYRLPTDVSRPVGDTRQMLERFTRIRNAADVIAFGRRYGTLGICEHGRPRTHSMVKDEWGRAVYCTPDLPRFEPLDRWLHYAHQGRWLVHLAAELVRPSEPDEPAGGERYEARMRCWRQIYRSQLSAETQAKARGEWPAYGSQRSWEERIDELSRSRAVARVWFQGDVNDWLEEGDVRPRVALSPDYQSAEDYTCIAIAEGTFGVLAVQLLSVALRAREVATCDACGGSYLRLYRRSPVGPAGRHNYCSDCGKRAAWRLGQQDRRARQAAARIPGPP